MQKLITKLYNKYCRPEIKSLYLGGIQRDFSKDITKKDEMERQQSCKAFVDSGICDLIFNEVLKEYLEVLHNIGETEAARDMIFNNINVVLAIEERIRLHAPVPQKEELIDPYNPL